jgi:hypothetical protein
MLLYRTATMGNGATRHYGVTPHIHHAPHLALSLVRCPSWSLLGIRYKCTYFGSEDLTEVSVRNTVFRVVTPCNMGTSGVSEELLPYFPSSFDSFNFSP